MPAFEPSAEHRRDCERLAAAARDAGAVAMKYFRGPLKSWTKGQGDSPVSEADIASNELLRERLLAPGDGWLSEESENDPLRLDARRVWVVDPIDGTRAYLAGREDWSISVALVEAGRPVVAAIYAPVTDELFLAIAGAGATCNDVAMRASGGGALDGARIAGPKRMMERVVTQVPALIVVPRIHSLALRLVRVAQSEIDGAVAGGSGHDWDLAAADLLVHEAGGTMTALDGKALIYNRPAPVHGVLVAAGRERHNALIDIVRAQMSEPA